MSSVVAYSRSRLGPSFDPRMSTTWIIVDEIVVSSDGFKVRDTGLVHCESPHIRDLIEHPQYEPEGRIPW